MANEQNRLQIEQLKNLIQSLHYDMSGYAITPTELTATVKINVKDLDQSQQNIVELQFKRIIATQGWIETSAQKFEDYLVFYVSKVI